MENNINYISYGRNFNTYWNLRSIAGNDCLAY